MKLTPRKANPNIFDGIGILSGTRKADTSFKQ